jgi:hypothetical protein
MPVSTSAAPEGSALEAVAGSTPGIVLMLRRGGVASVAEAALPPAAFS